MSKLLGEDDRHDAAVIDAKRQVMAARPPHTRRPRLLACLLNGNAAAGPG